MSTLPSVCSEPTTPQINIPQSRLHEAFNREPLEFDHNLSGLSLFEMDSLHTLADRMAATPRDYFVAGSAPTPGTGFYSVASVAYTPAQAIENLSTGAHRILLKRAENHDSRFRELIDTLFAQIVHQLGGLGGQKVVRLESGILISSAATITPFHFDPEIGFFSQIRGPKMYHVYSPSVITEEELGRCSLAGPAALAPVELAGRDHRREHVFELGPGKGFHQPHSAPHWVETGDSISVSYTFVFETDATRAKARTIGFNHYMRRLRLNPQPLGKRPTLDAMKSEAMRTLIPARQFTSSMRARLKGK